ncbi:MAG: LemA family protein [Desulfobacterales bacterium]|nr:LemA family protein [Desulfobacterales bacterium]
MRKDNVTTVIQRAYGRRYRLDSSDMVSRPRYYLSRVEPILALIKQKRFKIITILILALVAGGSIYYYNLLVSTEQDVLASKGKVHALLQRRNDISINLSKAVFDYSRHERGVFTAVVALRSILSEKGITDSKLEELLNNFEKKGLEDSGKAGEMAVGLDPVSALSRLLAIAEQYPDLKLSSNFLSLMTALVEVEKDLAGERIKYNDAANVYTTNMAKFPINMYAWIFGFELQPYFEATDEAKRLKPIDY